MIKKLLLLLCLCGSAWATTTVSGNLKNLGTGAVTTGSSVRFYLRGCGGNLPRINGTAIIAPSLGNVFYFDFVPNSSGAISGTLYSTRDSTGLLGGDIECGGSNTAVWYGFVPFLNGKAGPETPIHAKNSATIDISNITPITSNPVITAPTGDSTYMRLDAGNSPATGAWTFNAALTAVSETVTGALTAGSIPAPGPIGGTTPSSGSFTSINNVIKADQQTGADACAKLVAAMNALPAGGGTVDATGFQGAQTCGSNTALSKSGVAYLFPANVTFSATAGITITISGNDVLFQGTGDTTIFDFTGGTSANNNFSATGSRITIQGINVKGNRVAGGTATCISLNPGSTQDRNTVQFNTIQNCGAVGIYSIKQTHLTEYKNIINSTGQSTMFHDVGQQFTRVEGNIDTDYNLSNTAGHGGIMANGTLTTDQQDMTVINNLQQENTSGSNHVGIGLNGVTGALVAHNRVVKSLGTGEAIAVTGSKVRIGFNEVSQGGGCGILFFALVNFSSDFTIANNISNSNSSSGICLVWGANNVTIQDGVVSGNRMKGNTVDGFQTYNGASFTGMAIKNVQVFGNAWLGNTAGTFNALSAGVTGQVSIFGNTDTDNDNGFKVNQQMNVGGGTTTIGGQTNITGELTVTTDLRNAGTIAAGSGFVRMGNTDKPCWRNNANTADDCHGEIQTKRGVAGCTTGGAAGNSCASDITVTWPSAFADANYTVTCSGNTPTNAPSAPFVVSGTQLAATVHINYFAITAAAASYASVECTAVHD